MSAAARQRVEPSVLSLAQLLAHQPPATEPYLIDPGLLPPQGILFVGGEPKVGKSLLVANRPGLGGRLGPCRFFPSPRHGAC